MTALTVSDVLTVGGSTIVVGLLIEILKRAMAWSASTVDRFGPLVAAVFGIVLVLAAAVSQGQTDYLQAALTGFLGGLSAAGLSDIVGTLPVVGSGSTTRTGLTFSGGK